MVKKKENFSDQDKPVGKKPFVKPKLKYIKPKLIKYGKMKNHTTGVPPFIGPVSPPPPGGFDGDHDF